MIEIKNVSKTFDNFSAGNDSNSKAVNNVTLDIRENACFGLVGTNGSGKSTLLRMISDVYRPDTGTITVDGKKTCDHTDVRKKFFIFLTNSTFSAMRTRRT